MQFGDPNPRGRAGVVEVGRFFNDMKDLLRRHPFSDKELEELYFILENRLRHINCTECGKNVPKHKTKTYGQELDKLRPVCEDCFKKLP